MHQNAASAAKAEIESLLRDYLTGAGICLQNHASAMRLQHSDPPAVVIESLEDAPFEGSDTCWEIRLVLGIQASPSRGAPAEDIYAALHVNQLDALPVVLMSLQIEPARDDCPRRATIRYIFG
jgi:hypothetical protein